jgi:hypothetical protein
LLFQKSLRDPFRRRRPANIPKANEENAFHKIVPRGNELFRKIRWCALFRMQANRA